MKRLAMIPVFVVLSLPAFAEEQDRQQMKRQVIEHIDARIRILQETRDCVDKAANMGAVAVCHETERKKTRALRRQTRDDLQEGKAAPR